MKYNYLVPNDFTNLVTLSDGQEYHQTTLSSGKRLLFISNLPVNYQQAVETCSSHGADVFLPIDQAENDDVVSFLTSLDVNSRNFNRGYPLAWLRAVKLESGWVDAKTNEPLVYDGPDDGRFGGLFNWPYGEHLNAFLG